MATGQRSDILSHLHRLALRPDGAGMSDAQLLQQFLSCREESAFEALVQRHGSMVWGVCRRVLRNQADAEDAFQATFLVLVRKASAIRPREAVGNWLYGVAFRTAMKARTMSARRRAKEMQIEPMAEYDDPTENDYADLAAVLDREIECLPDSYRRALVLCELQGMSRKEAARQLEIPEGTLSSRLARGRALLGRRLRRRGITLSAGALAAFLAENMASACPSTTLVVVEAATAVATGQAATAVISARVAALTEGVIKAMLVNQLKALAFLSLLLGFLCVGSIPLLLRAGIEEEPEIGKPNAVAPPANAAGQRKSDQELIQGRWLPVRVEDGGRVENLAKVKDAILTFTAKKMILAAPGKKKKEMTYRLNPRKFPKWIDFTENGKVTPGIYELKGDMLKIVIDETATKGRPTAFVSQQGSVNDLLMIFKRADKSTKQDLPEKKEEQKPQVKKTFLPPGAVELQFDKPLELKLQSNPIMLKGRKFSIVGIGRGTFHLSKESRLTAKLNAGVTQYAKVDYWIYAAVFDRHGRLLGTASHREKVDYIRLGGAPCIFREIELDFGISNAFRRAAYVVVTIGERDVPEK